MAVQEVQNLNFALRGRTCLVQKVEHSYKTKIWKNNLKKEIILAKIIHL